MKEEEFWEKWYNDDLKLEDLTNDNFKNELSYNKQEKVSEIKSYISKIEDESFWNEWLNKK